MVNYIAIHFHIHGQKVIRFTSPVDLDQYVNHNLTIESLMVDVLGLRDEWNPKMDRITIYKEDISEPIKVSKLVTNQVERIWNWQHACVRT